MGLPPTHGARLVASRTVLRAAIRGGCKCLGKLLFYVYAVGHQLADPPINFSELRPETVHLVHGYRPAAKGSKSSAAWGHDSGPQTFPL